MYSSAEGCASRCCVLKAPGASYGWLSVSNVSTESSLTKFVIIKEILVYKPIFKSLESNPKCWREFSSFRIAHHPCYGQTLMVPAEDRTLVSSIGISLRRRDGGSRVGPIERRT